MGLKELYLPVIIFIALLVFIKARRKFGFVFFFIFSSYLIINFLVESVSVVIVYKDLSNLLIYNISMLIEGLVFCYMFYYISSNRVIKKAVIISITVFILFWTANFFFIQKSTDTLDTYTYLLSCIILATFSLITIYRFVFHNSFDNPFYNFFFWASIGILFCYLGNIPYLAAYNILVIKDRMIAYSLNIISQVVNSILYIMIIIGALCHRPERN
jgi:hypothetical protein